MKTYILKKVSLFFTCITIAISFILTFISYLDLRFTNFSKSIIILIVISYILLLTFSYILQIIYIVYFRKEFKNMKVIFFNLFIILLCFIFIGYFSIIMNYVDCLLLALIGLILQGYIYYKIDINTSDF